MFDRFSERARKTMTLARQEAFRFNHDSIGTEHILLGPVQQDTSVAAQALRELEIDSREIRVEVERVVRKGRWKITFGQLPFTPLAKQVLELSLEKAAIPGNDSIDTEHLLLGLLAMHECLAVTALTNLGIDVDAFRANSIQLLDAS